MYDDTCFIVIGQRSQGIGYLPKRNQNSLAILRQCGLIGMLSPAFLCRERTAIKNRNRQSGCKGPGITRRAKYPRRRQGLLQHICSQSNLGI